MGSLGGGGSVGGLVREGFWGRQHVHMGRWCEVSEKGVAGGGTGQPGWNNSQEGEGRAEE